MLRLLFCFAILTLPISPTNLNSVTAAEWMAGAARVNITPAEPMWMSGYGSRDKVAEGKLTDLWAKALVLKDSARLTFTVVSLDLVGIDRTTSLAIRQGICERHDVTWRT